MVPGDISHEEHTISQQKKSSFTVSRFFKMLFGFDFLEVLYLPPEFAQTVNHLAGQKIKIEDSCGERWSVTLSYVDGSLAFRKGWKKFYTDHNLEEGQLLVFSYTEGSHFSVRIYGTSACERTDFNYDRPRKNKSSRRNPQKYPQNEAVTTNDASSGKTQNLRGTFQNCETQRELTNVGIGSIQSHTALTGMEDPICMKHRDNEDEGECRRFCSGFSIFEMENGPVLDPEITEYANKTGKAIDTNASYACAGIAEQTQTSWYDAQMPAIHPGMVCEYPGSLTDNSIEDLTNNTEKAMVCNFDTHSMEQPNIKRDVPQKTVVRTSDDNLKQPYARSHDTEKGVVHTFDVGMESSKRRSNHNKAAICDSDTDSVEESETRRSHTEKGVVYDSSFDGIEQSKTGRRLTKKGVVYDSDSDGMDQPKATTCRTKKGVSCDSDTDSIEQSKTGMRYSKKGVACDSDGMELKTRRCGSKKGVVCDSNSDSIEQSKTRERHNKKGVTYDSDTDTDSLEQSKTRRFHTKKGLVAYNDSNTDADTDGIEQPKTKRHRIKRGES